ncbi:DUF4168 domain-containing protein [Salinimicrobium sediminilitoris]|jgi:hypothetical protein|uniref:DUF4168 domain-containing protein n=1 Tax=Salinimicrobium sediminilitoris TaxID=2876715 RepID=UPI001E3515B8|nr:DUF4168 domain-containing protein [Salinimicrobium sediminilitoris]MCC8361162.1 DUF4168 domain-containing protein [Salinimicrobium sediminilitoris]
MIRSNKMAGMIMFFMMLGSTAVFAQTPQMPQQEQQQTEVTDAELTKFVEALKGVQMVTQQAQQKMMQMVQEEGMEIPRFNEIHQASVDPKVEVEATSEEKATHKKIIGELETMQAGIQEQLESLIKDQGLSLERYEQIAMRLQSDTQLQQRIQQMIQG